MPGRPEGIHAARAGAGGGNVYAPSSDRPARCRSGLGVERRLGILRLGGQRGAGRGFNSPLRLFEDFKSVPALRRKHL